MFKSFEKIKSLKLVFCIVICLGLSSCATSQSQDQAYKTTGQISDPLEPLNRVIFVFNSAIDTILLEPIAKLYHFVTPDFAETAIQNFTRNLRTPVYAANNLLQGDIDGFGVSSARFLVNSTVGLAGLFDVAGQRGLKFEKEDFGQTLAVWGVGDGIYLVLPFMGPSSLRDTVGNGVDSFADPLRIYTENVDKEWIYYARNAVEIVDGRARLIDAIDDLKANSIDYYASVKSVYEQRRLALIHDGSAFTDDYFDEEY